MNNFIFYGCFDQYNFLNPKTNFYNEWDRINLLLSNNSQEKMNFVIPIDVFTLRYLQSIINLLYGLRTLYSINLQRIYFTLQINQEINEYNIQLLPDHYTEDIEHVWAFMVKKLIMEENSYSGFYTDEINQLDRIIEYRKNKIDLKDKNVLYKKILDKIKVLETLNNKDFSVIFPEMQDFLLLCKQS